MHAKVPGTVFLSQQILPVVFINPSSGLTPEEKLIKAHQHAFSCLKKEDMEEYMKTAANKPDWDQENDRLLTKAKEASVSFALYFDMNMSKAWILIIRHIDS